MSFTLKTLTEGIRDRHVGQQNKRLVEKWSRTGLLRGMDDVNRENMATMLENQAAQVLRESNTMSSGEVGGFTNIAFPIVRRVFGGLIANELVSIQPMSLPSGLLFYLDYTYGGANGPYAKGESIYGGPSGKAIQSGALATGGQYDLAGSGFSRKYRKAQPHMGDSHANALSRVFTTTAASAAALSTTGNPLPRAVRSELTDKLVQYDSVVLDAIDDESEDFGFMLIPLEQVNFPAEADLSMLKQISILEKDPGLTGFSAVPKSIQPEDVVGAPLAINIRRLNQIVKINNAGQVTQTVAIDDIKQFEAAPLAEALAHAAANDHALLCVVHLDGGNVLQAELGDNGGAVSPNIEVQTTRLDTVAHATDVFGEVEGKPGFEGDGSGNEALDANTTLDIPEIDIKIESIPVTAQTRKLRARWSPELAQDLNAYHSMDAEVELTQILSEQIALEIDREILGDLLTGAQGANFFWSRSPGKFVNKRTGSEIARTSTLNPGPAFTGTVREWYETLTETVIDVANEIHRKTLRGSANFIVVSPDVATILEASVLYRPSYSIDGDGQVGAPFTMGAEKVGTLSNRFTVYKDPYFPRNKILVGYKGGSYLETGFVYAPYVPLIVTPTIFQPDDFTPRKGVMTRYGKKMVRADFYGTVTCLDMNII